MSKETDELRREVAELRGRVDELSRMVAAMQGVARPPVLQPLTSPPWHYDGWHSINPNVTGGVGRAYTVGGAQ